MPVRHSTIASFQWKKLDIDSKLAGKEELDQIHCIPCNVFLRWQLHLFLAVLWQWNPVKSSTPTNQHPAFYRPGWMPFLFPNQQCQSAEGKTIITKDQYKSFRWRFASDESVLLYFIMDARSASVHVIFYRCFFHIFFYSRLSWPNGWTDLHDTFTRGRY